MVTYQRELQSAQIAIAVREVPKENVQEKYNFHFNTADPCAICFAKLFFFFSFLFLPDWPQSFQVPSSHNAKLETLRCSKASLYDPSDNAHNAHLPRALD